MEFLSKGDRPVGLELVLLLAFCYPFWLARCSSLRSAVFWRNWVHVVAWCVAALDYLERLAELAGSHLVIGSIFERESHSSYLVAHLVERALDRMRRRTGPYFLWQAWSSWDCFLQKETSEHVRSCTWLSIEASCFSNWAREAGGRPTHRPCSHPWIYHHCAAG